MSQCCIFCSTEYKKNHPIHLFTEAFNSEHYAEVEDEDCRGTREAFVNIQEIVDYLYCPNCDNLYLRGGEHSWGEEIGVDAGMAIEGENFYQWIGNKTDIENLIQAYATEDLYGISRKIVEFVDGKPVIVEEQQETKEEVTDPIQIIEEEDDLPF